MHPFKCRHARQHRHHIFAQGPARGSFIVVEEHAHHLPRRLAHEQLQQDDAEGVHVRARADLAVAMALWCHTAACSEDDRDFFARMQEHKDPRPGAWPKKVVTVLAGAAKGCTEFRPRERATVRDVLPKVRALQKLLR